MVEIASRFQLHKKYDLRKLRLQESSSITKEFEGNRSLVACIPDAHLIIPLSDVEVATIVLHNHSSKFYLNGMNAH